VFLERGGTEKFLFMTLMSTYLKRMPLTMKKRASALQTIGGNSCLQATRKLSSLVDTMMPNGPTD
jgi:hypothetical protein